MSDDEKLTGRGELDELLKRPTQHKWRVELGYLIAGKRDADWRRSGSPSEYVTQRIEDADDPELSKVCFEEAFSKIISAWDPQSDDPPAKFSIIFELLMELGNAGEAQGGDQLIGLLALQQAPYLPQPNSDDIATRHDLHIQAFQVLERYFPNESETAIYGRYRRLLQRYFQRDECRAYHAYVVAQLLQLHEFDPWDEAINQLKNDLIWGSYLNIAVDRVRNVNTKTADATVSKNSLISQLIGCRAIERLHGYN